MAQTLLKRIYLGKPDTGTDISDYIESFSYRRGIDKDNNLELKTQGTAAEYLLSLSDFYPNKIITFSYGYITGKMSTPNIVLISDIEPDWSSSGLTLRIRCIDKGNTMKKVTSNRVWKKKSTPEIVAEVAKLHGLQTNIVPVDSSLAGSPNGGFKTWGSLPQANMNNMQLVKHLATKEGNAEYVAYVDNTTLHFKPIGVGDDSKRTINIKDDGTVIRFSIKHRETTGVGEIGVAKVNGGTAKDEKSKWNIKSLSIQKGFSFNGWLGLGVQNAIIYAQQGGAKNPLREVGVVFEPNGQMREVVSLIPGAAPAGDNVSKVKATKSAQTSQPSSDQGSDIVSTVLNGIKDFTGAIGDLQEGFAESYTMGENKVAPSAMPDVDATAGAKRAQSRNTRKILTATLVLYGDPGWVLDSVLTISGIHERFIGNWHISSIDDDFGNGYTTTLELTKNAVKTSNNGVTPKKVNATIGKGASAPVDEKVKVTGGDGTIYNDKVIVAPGYELKARIGQRNEP